MTPRAKHWRRGGLVAVALAAVVLLGVPSRSSGRAEASGGARTVASIDIAPGGSTSWNPRAGSGIMASVSGSAAYGGQAPVPASCGSGGTYTWQSISRAAVTVGGDSEPMADLMCEASEVRNYNGASAYANINRWPVKVTLRPGAEGITGSVPIGLRARVDVTASGTCEYSASATAAVVAENPSGQVFWSCSASAAKSWDGINLSSSTTTSPGMLLSADGTATASTDVPIDTWCYITITTNAAIYNSVLCAGRGGQAQVIADPFIFVDPEWEYADRVMVVQPVSISDQTTLVEMTRPWNSYQNPVAPVADAGADLERTTAQVEGSTLSGAASDANLDALTMRWLDADGEEIAGPVTFTGGGGHLDLELPALPAGTHAFSFEVTDGVETVADTVLVAVANTPPTIETASGPATCLLGEEVVLSAEVADFDGDELAWAWYLGDELLEEGTVASEAGGAPVALPDATVAAVVLGEGAHEVTLKVADGFGNEVVASPVLVEILADTTPPAVTAPGALVVEATSAAGQAVALGWAVATDDIGPVTVANDAPSLFFLGSTVVTWTATDAAGNSATATQTVTVVDTTAPTLTAPAAVTAEAASASGTAVSLGTATASDLLGPVTVANDAPAAFPLGATVVTWTATDAAGNSATATQTVTIVDTTAPTLTVPADISVPCASADGTPVDLGAATATDLFGPVSVTNDAPALFPCGTTVVTWTATDAHGLSATGTQTVVVTQDGGDDTTPPVLAPVATPTTLWPADNKMAGVDLVANATDDGGGPVALTVSVACNEAPAAGESDAEVVSVDDAAGTAHLHLRAKREGKGSGRTYTITVTATDAAGNAATATVTVTVPHDQGKKK